MEHVDRIEANITEYDRILSHIAKTDHRSQRLMELKGVGPTTACALVASIGNAHDFKNGRQLAAWLGLTPSQYSSGGKSKLGRITKAGDSYHNFDIQTDLRYVNTAAKISFQVPGSKACWRLSS